MLSAISNAGRLRFRLFTGSFNGPVFIDFLGRLLRDCGGRKVHLIVDGHPVHRSQAVTQFASGTDGRLRIFRLPGYSPELNPDEWVWKNVKHDRVGRASIAGKADFKARVVSALRRLQKLPHVIRGFFADPNLVYIAA